MYKDLVKKIIRKLRNRNPSWKEQLISNGCKLVDGGEILLPNGISMNFTKELEYILYEIYVENDYMFFDNKETVFIDIGMNVASTTLYFSCKSNVKKVYSFEPFPYTFKQAEANIKLNPKYSDKVCIFNYGLSNNEQELTIPYCKQETGCMSIKNSKDRLDKILPVNCTVENVSIKVKDASSVLTPILQNHTREQIVVKIDTEGSEYDIFDSLEKGKVFDLIDIILLEYHNGFKMIEDTLVQNNFTVFYKDNKKNSKVGMIYAVKGANKHL